MGLATTECWLMGWHDRCSAPEFCDCICHDAFTDDDWEELTGGPV